MPSPSTKHRSATTRPYRYLKPNGAYASYKGLSRLSDHSPLQGLFAVGWVMLGAFCLLNLFVGVLVSTFAEIRATEEGTCLMSEGQKDWAETMGRMLALKPTRRILCPEVNWRAQCFYLAKWKKFETCAASPRSRGLWDTRPTATRPAIPSSPDQEPTVAGRSWA